MDKLQRKVLVVDDEPDLVDTMVFFLEDAGLLVTSAGGGNQAKATLQNEKFDLVITDVRMPDGNGLDLLKYISKEIPGLPVMMMSAYTDTQPEEFLKLGAVAFAAKPLDFNTLVAQVLKILKK